MMATITTLILFTQAVFALFLAVLLGTKESANRKENAVLILHMIMVFIWNISYVVMFNSKDSDENLRYVCRSVAMFAIVFSVIFCNYIMMQCISMEKNRAKTLLILEILLGFYIYPIIIARDAVVFVKASYGWTYEFQDYIGRIPYNIFISCVSFSILGMAVYGIRRGKHKREKILGWYGIVCFLIMGVGMMTDTILPLFGFELFPGSATAMFLCTCLIYRISVQKGMERLTISNVSPHIFGSLDTPMLVINDENHIVIVNRAAGLFFQMADDRILDHGLLNFFELEQIGEIMPNQSYDVKCKVNQADCRLRFSTLYDAYHEPLGATVMFTDMTDKISMIEELEMYRNHLQEKLDEKTQELEAVILQAISAVANTIDAKDEYTKGHSIRVAQYSCALARAIGKDEKFVNNLNYMALLHDIGKIGVPDSVLNKVGRLTDTEFGLIKQHTTIGAEILKDITMVEGVALGAKYHHERYDGKGYPNGLKGQEIPFEARLIGIADAFDAMTSNRCYRRKMSMDVVVGELERGSGTQFDPELVSAFIKLVNNGILITEEQELETSIVSESNKLLLNILERQNEQTKLEADYDYLTQLYNRKACEREIEHILSEGGKGVPLVIGAYG